MTVVRQNEDLLTVVRDHARQLRELRRRTLFGAAITEGDMSVRTPEGNTVMQVGQIPYGSGTVSGMAVYRDDGTLQARFFDTAGGGGFWSLYDEAENAIVSNDTVSGVGLATPYITCQVMPSSEVTTPPTVVTAAGFTNYYRVHYQRQHPRLRCLLICVTDAATTGEIVLNQGGTQISTVLPIAASSNDYFTIDGTVTGNYLSVAAVDVQARRASGAGTFRIAVAWSAGVQS